MQIRQFKASDSTQIWELFFGTVRTINTNDYTPTQLDVWAPIDTDAEAWAESRLGANTVVMVNNGKIIGFGDIDDTGYIDFLYVEKDSVGKGFGTILCDELEKRSQSKELTTYASITARPFFEKRGYWVVRENEVERHGVILKNYFMIKQR